MQNQTQTPNSTSSRSLGMSSDFMDQLLCDSQLPFRTELRISSPRNVWESPVDGTAHLESDMLLSR